MRDGHQPMVAGAPNETLGAPAAGMLRIRNLTLLLTLQCPATCLHCGTNSSPTHRAAMSPALARAAIFAAARRNLPLVLSGGEPMLRPTLVLELAQLARASGIAVAVSSNAYWAADLRSARALVGRLAAAGVDALLLSTDVFHAAFVPWRRVEHAARAARELGLKCQIALPSRPNDRFTKRLERRFAAIDGVVVRRHPISATGRARELPAAMFEAGVHDRACDTIGELAILPDGRVLACCAGSIDLPSAAPLSGRSDEDLDAAIARFQGDPLLREIQEQGPLRAAVWEHGRRRDFVPLSVLAFPDLCSACRCVCVRAAVARGQFSDA
ncbi:MAG TPA: radical SAM protein [Opitutaceae bacterium]|nr:radical SAM protein [Opitutaceae bacterium]